MCMQLCILHLSSLGTNAEVPAVVLGSLRLGRYPVEQDTSYLSYLFVRCFKTTPHFISFSLAVSDLEGSVAFRNFGTVSLEVSLHCRHVTDRKKQFILQSLLRSVLWQSQRKETRRRTG
jgi:hypothetical protein